MERSAAHRVIISSIDLPFKREEAGGAGPAVEAPSVVAGAALDVCCCGLVVDGVVAGAVVVAGAWDVSPDVACAELAARFPKSEGAADAGAVVLGVVDDVWDGKLKDGAAVVAGVLVLVEGPPSSPNRLLVLVPVVDGAVEACVVEFVGKVNGGVAVGFEVLASEVVVEGKLKPGLSAGFDASPPPRLKAGLLAFGS